VNSTNYETRYALFCITLLLPLSSVQIFSTATSSQTPEYVLILLFIYSVLKLFAYFTFGKLIKSQAYIENSRKCLHGHKSRHCLTSLPELETRCHKSHD